MAVVNIKRVFNRLFIGLSVVWAVYCVVVIHPHNELGKAFSRFMQSERDCALTVVKGKERLDKCVKLAKSEFAQDQLELRNFYVAAGPRLLTLVIGLPLLIYAALRGMAAVFVRIWRGDKTKENTVGDSPVPKSRTE